MGKNNETPNTNSMELPNNKNERLKELFLSKVQELFMKIKPSHLDDSTRIREVYLEFIKRVNKNFTYPDERTILKGENAVTHDLLSQITLLSNTHGIEDYKVEEIQKLGDKEVAYYKVTIPIGSPGSEYDRYEYNPNSDETIGTLLRTNYQNNEQQVPATNINLNGYIDKDGVLIGMEVESSIGDNSLDKFIISLVPTDTIRQGNDYDKDEFLNNFFHFDFIEQLGRNRNNYNVENIGGGSKIIYREENIDDLGGLSDSQNIPSEILAIYAGKINQNGREYLVYITHVED